LMLANHPKIIHSIFLRHASHEEITIRSVYIFRIQIYTKAMRPVLNEQSERLATMFNHAPSRKTKTAF